MIALEKISVVGLGYVGLCTAASFAVKGYQVIVSDNNSSRVEMVNKCFSPFYEPELENILKEGIAAHKFNAVLRLEEAVRESEVVFMDRSKAVWGAIRYN
jgi:UDPglucose 6-dehydrogenase